ncbi:TMV resistance protein N-like [Camellia sinensis]|uniref:TMV resistance protein N-like n=1 Tax=Camellia sinensis TaxID=4442 RepID=UPI001036ED84|nr:TMV resistance protein N-like [Camellia sinensis]
MQLSRKFDASSLMVMNEERFEISNERFGGSAVEAMREDNKGVEGAIDQLFDNLIGKLDLIHRRSKIILTTRNKHLLKTNEVYIFKIKELDSNKSLELFSWHAFGQDHPLERYFAHSQSVMWHCRGLSLALKLLGSSLSDKRLDIWKSALQKLKNNPEKRILEILKISYDTLDDHDKNLFLYIACLFNQRGKDSTVRILDACDFCSERGMDNLIDRCLLTFTQKILMMHHLLQDMGIYIVRQQSSNELGKCRLLGCHEDSFNILRRKMGTKKIEGLYLDMHVLEKESWFNKTFCDLEIAFASMENLILLMLNGVEIKGGYTEFPKRLRWLSWHGYSQKSIPSDFSLESLVGLELWNSKLEHNLDLSGNPIYSLPESIKGLIGLRSLSLYHCTRLQSLSELPIGECSSLEMITNIPNWTTYLGLNTDGCEKLVEVQGFFKLEPIGNADAKIINSLGLIELESMGSLEVDLWNNITDTHKKYLLQCGSFLVYIFEGFNYASKLGRQSEEFGLCIKVGQTE